MTRIGYCPGKSEKNNVTTFLENLFESHPERTLFYWVSPSILSKWTVNRTDHLPHQTCTVQTFVRQVRQVAAGFLKLGIQKGDRVLLFLPMSVPMYATLAGLQRIGAIPVFLDSWARRNELGHCAQIAQPAAIISSDAIFEACQTVAELQSIPIKISTGTNRSNTHCLAHLINTPEEAPITPVASEDSALITFTTGSSGTPKGANRTHRFLSAQHEALNRTIPYTPEDVDLPVFPIFSLNNIAGGVPSVLPALDAGVPTDRDTQILIAQMAACRVTCATLSPALFEGLSTCCLTHNLPLPNLRRVVTGGAPIGKQQIKNFMAIAPGAEIHVLYGSTEVEPIAHLKVSDTLAGPPSHAEDGVNVGRIVSGLQFKLLKINREPIVVHSDEDWKMLEAEPGTVGELIVAGEHVCQNYHNDENAVARTKIRDTNGLIYHRTGDLARIDACGDLWVVGRVHNAIRRKGRFLYPVKAELALKQLPFVKHAAYLGMPDQELEEMAVCVVEPTTEGDEKNRCNTIKHLMKRNNLPVDRIVFRTAIPLDPRHHSKVEYHTLRQQLQQENLS